MNALTRLALAATGIVLSGTTPSLSQEKVGEAVLIRTSVTGDSGPMVTKAPVHRDERIRTSATGLGEFLFRDGTKFAVGWNSSVVIDKFVFEDSKSVKRLSLNTAKGTFRWISGKSPSSAYEIVTPAGTIGVRGTVFDFYVGGSGVTAVVLLSGAVRFCGTNGACQELTRRCDVLIATPSTGVSAPDRVDRNIFNTLGTRRALPFLSGTQRLSSQFRRGTSGCGLSTASLDQQKERGDVERPEPRREPRQEPPPPDDDDGGYGDID